MSGRVIPCHPVVLSTSVLPVHLSFDLCRQKVHALCLKLVRKCLCSFVGKNPQMLIFAFVQNPKCYGEPTSTFSVKSCRFAFPAQQEEVASLTHAVICTCASEEPDPTVLECFSLKDWPVTESGWESCIYLSSHAVVTVGFNFLHKS